MEILSPSEKIILRSCAGPHNATWLTVIPHSPDLQFDDAEFRCALRRRLHLPVNLLDDKCLACRAQLDPYGFHVTTCMRTGLVHARHKCLVQCWRTVCKEAGVNIPDRNVERLIRDTHLRHSANDGRRLDLITPGVGGIFSGKPLFIDVTCISPVTGRGVPKPRAANVDDAAAADKDRVTRERDYPDIERSDAAQLLSLSVEIYRRWGKDSLNLVRALVHHKNDSMPDLLKRSAATGFTRRWWGLLSCSLQRTLARAILQPHAGDLFDAQAGNEMPLPELLDYFAR